MVVALLAMLFVVGVAFLQSVTFDARQIGTEITARQERAAVDTIEAKVFEALNAGWLAAGGTPYKMAGPDLVKCIADANNDGTCDDVSGDGLADYALNGPAYGELSYLDGIMAPLEPYLYYSAPGASPIPVLPYPGHVGSALAGEPATLRGFFDSAEPARINLNTPPDWAVDADGDGIPESREFDLTATGAPFTLPPALRETLQKQLNEPDATANGVFLSVRAVPHGALVDINWSHPELVYAVMPEDFGSAEFPTPLRTRWNAPGGRPYDPYRPETEEAALRHRGGLPQRRLNESALQRDFQDRLLGLQRLDPTQSDPAGTFADHRWWFHRLAERGADAEVPFWFSIIASPYTDPATLASYDRRHLLTTYSTDNLLMRDGTWRVPPDAADVTTNGRGWIEMILKDTQDPYNPVDFGRWALDDYPDAVPKGDPRKGRIQISLPYLEASLLGDPRTDPVHNGINSLQARLDPMGPTAIEDAAKATRFIRTIQDAFLLMLRNVPASKMADDTKAHVAASLTANLIDFADSDDMPTEVEVLGVDGLPLNPRQYVFGLERQPFITEVYTKVQEDVADMGTADPANSFSVIELYNPYDKRMADPPAGLNLSQYELHILDVNNSEVVGSPIQLTGPIPWGPEGFKLFGIGNASLFPPGTVQLSWDVNLLLKNGWKVRVTRVRPSTPPKTILVDEFVINGSSGFYSDSTLVAGNGPPPDKADESVERAMWRLTTTPPSAYWTAVVPVTKAFPNAQTLGAANTWQGEDDGTPNLRQRIRPVQVDFANTRYGLAEAFPTTGTLLLLMRHANSEKGGAIDRPFNSYLKSDELAPNEWQREQYQIDNGRMPVFDVAGKHRIAQTAPARPELSSKLPMGYDYLPWGQYVFDYFTALPLDNIMGEVDPDPEAPPKNVTPEVDSAGARVYGRINLNAAPWPVLAGLPLVKPITLPADYRSTLVELLYGGAAAHMNEEVPLGEYTAKAIVAYRDARRIPGNPVSPNTAETGDYRPRAPESASDPEILSFPFDPNVAHRFGELRKGSGFLTVGELANARHWDAWPNAGYSDWRTDSGVIGRLDGGGYPSEDYVQAVGVLVALGDWVTTRSNVWTVYGTLRGNRVALRDQLRDENPSLSLPEATRIADERLNKRAIRFEETVDRLPSFLKPGSPPQRIGERKVGTYNNTRAD